MFVINCVSFLVNCLPLLQLDPEAVSCWLSCLCGAELAYTLCVCVCVRACVRACVCVCVCVCLSLSLSNPPSHSAPTPPRLCLSVCVSLCLCLCLSLSLSLLFSCMAMWPSCPLCSSVAILTFRCLPVPTCRCQIVTDSNARTQQVAMVIETSTAGCLEALLGYSH